ncbi:MAG: ECF subfamily RNA polymerase sigma factor [Bacteroidia bacterium]|nr:MAG: ECF subfamily RNA polymerase sigma factor [Bacteroidia bacterium]
MKPISKHHVNASEMEEEFGIIERSKKDIDAFKPLYHKYYNEIKRSVENTLYVHYAIKNDELTKDITASVFEQALTKLHQYKAVNGVPFKSWLYRIMQNEITEYIRKIITKEKYERYIVQHSPKYDEIQPITSFATPEDIRISYLKKYLPRLGETEQMLIQYRFINDFSYKEISRRMGMSENSLRTRMTRLLRKIQSYLEQKGA